MTRYEEIRSQSAALRQTAARMRAEAAEMNRTARDLLADTVAQRERIRRDRNASSSLNLVERSGTRNHS